MAIRIGQYVLSGELRNTSRNSVFGWMQFAPDYGIRVELTGNFEPQLQGKHLRFRLPRMEDEGQVDLDSLPDFVHELADRQIGVVGKFAIQSTKVPAIPIDEFLDLSPEQQKLHLKDASCLHLEWFSQNGHVLAEIVDPIIEFVDPDEESTESEEQDFDSDYAEIYFDENGLPQARQVEDDEEDEEDDETETDDPFGLFGEDLGKRVAESLSGEIATGGQEESADTGEKRPWDEVIPGLDAETKAMYDQWDEIFEGKKDEPISFLFKHPLKLPRPERVKSQAEAEGYVRAILAELALLSVALDVCEHFSPLDTYRLLMDEILPTAKVHPNLAASEMVQHYATSDYCDECEAEFDASYEESLEGMTSDSNEESDNPLADEDSTSGEADTEEDF
ncbi:MAG: hypothetical protein NXI32_05730 [bacterium]|nr:hypothetical protein [bacterium]